MILILVIASIVPYQVFGDPVPIVGGRFSDIYDNPWLVSIQRHDFHMCVGSIISDKLILTAAHCVSNCSPDSLIVRVGSSRTDSEGTWHKVVGIRTHENYGTLAGALPFDLNDVALMKVETPIKFGILVNNTQLARKGDNVIPGTTVRVAGWGSVRPISPPIKQLRSAELQIIDSVACAKAYGDKKGVIISSNHLLCAAQRGQDACWGDSGGPLVAEDVQVGIVSTGIGCAHPKYPGIYTDVAHHRDWIDRNARILESSEYYGGKLAYQDPITNETFVIPNIV